MPEIVVMVDDSEADRVIAQHCYKKSGLPYTWQSFSSGEELIAHLRSNPELELRALFVDINMPGMSGHEVLEKIRDLPVLQRRPRIAMLTSSDNPYDMARAADANVADFCTKPTDVSGYLSLFDAMLS